MADFKKQFGQFFTINSDQILKNLGKYVKDKNVIDPFAGNGDLIRWAKENGADEALILNPDGSISETNTANILVIKGKRVIKPVSPHALPGIMEEAVRAFLSGMEYSMEKRKIFPEEILSADRVILTNSLMGAVPALRIDEKKLADSSKLCTKINMELF